MKVNKLSSAQGARERIGLEMREKGYIPLRELSERWGLGAKAAGKMRNAGRISGGIWSKESKMWFIPENTERPIPAQCLRPESSRETRIPMVALGSWAMWRPPVVRRSYGWFGAEARIL